MSKDSPTKGGSKAIVQPLELSTTFERDTDGSYPGGYFYTRHDNPNRSHLEKSICALEQGADAIAFASGTAASLATLMALSSGDHILVPRECYHGTHSLVRQIFPRWGLHVTFVDMTDLEAVRAAITPTTKLIWVETPSNPCLSITDLGAITALAHDNKAWVVCDSTLATPINQTPLDFGCDLVLHSTTKYLNGHSDVLGGALITRERGELHERLRMLQVCGGGVPSPFDCWLTSRSLATLKLRVEQQNASALKVATFLQTHARIKRVYYPGLPSHPQHQLAVSQMRGFGGLLSFQVTGGEAEAMAVVGAVGNMHRATSLGGVETLIEHRASMEGKDSVTPRDLVRLAVGVEPVDDIIGALASALC